MPLDKDDSLRNDPLPNHDSVTHRTRSPVTPCIMSTLSQSRYILSPPRRAGVRGQEGKSHFETSQKHLLGTFGTTRPVTLLVSPTLHLGWNREGSPPDR